MKRLAIAFVLSAALAGTAVIGSRAADPPHSGGVTFVETCDSTCHALHTSMGGTLTAATGNVNLCQSCHNTGKDAADLPMVNSDVAVPGMGGTSHGFDVPATNASYGAAPPSNAQLSQRVMNNRVVCSTCHDQHLATSARGGTPRIGRASKRVSTGGSGTMVSGGTFTGTDSLWYLIEITSTGSQNTARFRWSNDGGLTWMATNVSCGNGAPVALSNGVTVTFTGGANSFQATERWELAASWPFLRAALDSGDNSIGVKFCRDCHSDWAQTHTDVRNGDGTWKSHPVGITLGTNAAGYDRAAPLDANGLAQAGDRDGNPSNDLTLDAGGLVQCLSCHGVHYADSNSSTSDRR
jgi:predicted CXXCH cytochrome family protein